MSTLVCLFCDSELFEIGPEVLVGDPEEVSCHVCIGYFEFYVMEDGTVVSYPSSGPVDFDGDGSPMSEQVACESCGFGLFDGGDVMNSDREILIMRDELHELSVTAKRSELTIAGQAVTLAAQLVKIAELEAALGRAQNGYPKLRHPFPPL